MNRKISICIIIFMAALALVLPAAAFFGKSENDVREGTELPAKATETQIVEKTVIVSADNTVNYVFVLRERDGRVVVCRPESKDIYMETGILAEDLPQDIQERLVDGIGFVSEEILLQFLESYSS